MTRQPVVDIKGNSLDDGDGIRTVVFLKGCPLKCVWCHNPEGKDGVPSLSFDPDVCVDCGTCRRICPRGALSRGNEFYVDRTKCDLCLKCADACPSGALSAVGRYLEDEELLDAVLKDRPFFEASGGGVTLSGGEPTCNMEYFAHLCRLFSEAGVNVLVETCGFFDCDAFVEKALPFIDRIFFDLKIFDERDHVRYCGVSNGRILDNFVRLNGTLGADPGKILPRTPLIPGITDTDGNLNAISDFLVRNGVRESRLLPYNPLWLKKNFKIGVRGTVSLPDKFMPAGRVRECEAIYSEKGIKV